MGSGREALAGRGRRFSGVQLFVDRSVGANFVVCFFGPLLQRKCTRINLRDPALPQDNSAEDVIADGDQSVEESVFFLPPKRGQRQVNGLQRNFLLQLFERRRVHSDSTQVERHHEVFRAFAGIRITGGLKRIDVERTSQRLDRLPCPLVSR